MQIRRFSADGGHHLTRRHTQTVVIREQQHGAKTRTTKTSKPKRNLRVGQCLALLHLMHTITFEALFLITSLTTKTLSTATKEEKWQSITKNTGEIMEILARTLLDLA